MKPKTSVEEYIKGLAPGFFMPGDTLRDVANFVRGTLELGSASLPAIETALNGVALDKGQHPVTGKPGYTVRQPLQKRRSDRHLHHPCHQ